MSRTIRFVRVTGIGRICHAAFRRIRETAEKQTSRSRPCAELPHVADSTRAEVSRAVEPVRRAATPRLAGLNHRVTVADARVQYSVAGHDCSYGPNSIRVYTAGAAWFQGGD
jgi:hypothetical protein